MPKRRSLAWPIITIVVAILVVLTALPQQWKTWAPGFIRNPALHLGLDLAGGTQLDFRISEEEINAELADLDTQIADAKQSGATGTQVSELQAQRQSIVDQQQNLVEAIRTVLERRINALGVSEATITPSYVGNEKHLLVECPGVVDVQECISVVGKTIQLEFKEQFTEATDDFKKGVRAKAATAYAHITQSGSNLKKEGQDIGSQLGMAYSDSHAYFQDELPQGLEGLWAQQPGKVVMNEGSITQPQQDANGQVTEQTIPGIFLSQILKAQTATGRVINEAPKAFDLLAKTESGVTYVHHADLTLTDSFDPAITAALRSMKNGELKAITSGSGAKVLFLRGLTPGQEQIQASHILVSYKGATAAEATVTRTKEQALARAKDLKAQLDKGANFEDLARKESDGPSKTAGGKLGTLARGDIAPAFDDAAFKMKQGQISDPVETAYGYHIIRVDQAAAVTPTMADFDSLSVTGPNAMQHAQAMVEKMQNGKVTVTEPALTLRTLFFSLMPTGWKDTELDGKHFRHATVSIDSVTNIPVVQITFDPEGGKLFQQLTKNNIGKPIAIFVGGELVSAPRVQAEISGGSAVITGSRDINEARQLALDLNTGAIPAPIHLAGQYTVEATLGAAALQTSLMAALIGIIILMVYMVVIYRLLGLIADLALVVYAFLLIAILKYPLFLFSSNYIVLTLAGMAGIILSIGMAVDANVLVFERMKEELRKGKLPKSSVESSYKHAWPAIRDGNVSTLITCGILFLIGTSIVRGFAITLGIGTLLSMFTAIVVSRWIMRKVVQLPGSERPELYGAKRQAPPTV